MKLKEIKDLLNAVVLTGEDHLEDEVFCGFGSDLMSDVLCYANDDAILLTGLINRQVLNTAEMANMRCVVFVRNKRPSEDLIALAMEMDMLVMTTRMILFECCGVLYQHGLSGANKR
ncbi:hypothetical protein Q5O24_11615 [Eubacteriaceae bacterium ES3]|nr:hypothetical protein Q5O24_11615 [Eubacteriaceae bacterium ES3]